MLDKDPNPFPHIDLFPRIRTIGHALLNCFSLHQLSEVSDHFYHEELRGGGPTLDRELYDEDDRMEEYWKGIIDIPEQFDRVFGGGMAPKEDDGMGSERVPFS